MTKNVGQIDKIIRLVVGIILLLFFIANPSNWWGLLGIVPILTAFISFCPAYTLLKMSTVKKEEKK